MTDAEAEKLKLDYAKWESYKMGLTEQVVRHNVLKRPQLIAGQRLPI